jgi:hypothetical protein
MACGGEGGENVRFMHKKSNFYFKAPKKLVFVLIYIYLLV